MPRSASGIAALLVLCGTLASGCASARKERTEFLTTQLDTLVYPKPLDEVWQEARKLLAEQGYPMAEADAKAVGQQLMGFGDRILSPARETHPYGDDPGLLQRLGVLKSGAGGLAGLSLDTGWRRSGDRYHVDGFKETNGGCRVVFTHVVLDIISDSKSHNEKAFRDPEMELNLARRVDTLAAAKIDDQLDKMPR